MLIVFTPMKKNLMRQPEIKIIINLHCKTILIKIINLSLNLLQSSNLTFHTSFKCLFVFLIHTSLKLGLLTMTSVGANGILNVDFLNSI